MPFLVWPCNAQNYENSAFSKFSIELETISKFEMGITKLLITLNLRYGQERLITL